MIVVQITMRVFPEKQLEFTQTILSMIEPTEKEKGCARFIVCCDIRDKNQFRLLEEWDNRDNLNRHLKSHRFGVLLGAKSLLCQPIQINIHYVSSSEGIESVFSVRKQSHDIGSVSTDRRADSEERKVDLEQVFLKNS